MRPFLPLMAAALTLTAPAAAQDLGAIERCVSIVDNEERLACYDAAVAAVSQRAREAIAQRQREAEAAAKAQAEQQARAQVEAFGAENVQGAPRAEENARLLNAQIAEVLTDPLKRAVFVLSNGQMWRQTEGLSLPPVRAGDPVRIRRGAIGGYRLTLERQRRTVQVRRMR